MVKKQLNETQKNILEANIKKDILKKIYEIMKKDSLLDNIKYLASDIQSKRSLFLKGINEAREIFK